MTGDTDSEPTILFVIHLQARSKCGGDIMCELSHPRSYSGAGILIPARIDRASTPGLRATLEKWIERGLSEYTEDAEGEAVPRLTPATSEDFLPCVAMYLITQAACEVWIRTEEGGR